VNGSDGGRVNALRPLLTIFLIAVAGLGIVLSASWLGQRVGDIVGGADDGNVRVEPGRDVVLEIPEGASAAAIARLLEEAGVVSSAVQFEAAVRQSDVDQSLRAGVYELVTGMSPGEVIDVLRRGPVVVVFDVTIPEGLRVAEIIERLAEASSIAVAEFEQALTTRSVTTSLAELEESLSLSDWEGLLFPDTYRFSSEATPADMLNRMARTMEQRIATVDWTEFTDAGLTLYEGIIIASLIESEVKVADERPLVSSVIRNRLNAEMLLQIDATVLYALGTRDPAEFDSSIDSPYNTYRFAGLPPGPISAPGLASLEAAAAPAETSYLYYVLSAEDGSHTFSETLEEHNAAVAKSREEGILP